MFNLRTHALKVLALLLARPGELVQRADLHRELWDHGTFVDYEQGVNHCIKELRAALGDLAESPRYIETLARRGYRFIAPIERLATPSSAPLPASPAVPVEATNGPVTGVTAAVPKRIEAGANRTARPVLIATALGLVVAFVAIGLYPRRSRASESP